MNAPAHIDGAAYLADGSGVVRLGQVAILDLTLEGQGGDPQVLTGRFFAQRILRPDDSVLAEIEGQVRDATTVRFVLPVTEDLLPAGARAADLTYTVHEVLDDGEDEVLSRPFAVRQLRSGRPASALTVGADAVAVRYAGAPGLDAAQQAKQAGVIETDSPEALTEYLRRPAVEAAAAVDERLPTIDAATEGAQQALAAVAAQLPVIAEATQAAQTVAGQVGTLVDAASGAAQRASLGADAAEAKADDADAARALAVAARIGAENAAMAAALSSGNYVSDAAAQADAGLAVGKAFLNTTDGIYRIKNASLPATVAPWQPGSAAAIEAVATDLAVVGERITTGSARALRVKQTRADGSLDFGVTAEGHLLRSMALEPARHAQGGTPTALLDAAKWAGFYFDGTHLVRSMTQEPARHSASAWPMIQKDAGGWAGLMLDRQLHLVRSMAAEPARHVPGGFVQVVKDGAGWAREVFRRSATPGLAEPVPIGGGVNALEGQINHVLIYGQSNSLGYEALLLTTTSLGPWFLRFGEGVRPMDAGASPAMNALVELVETMSPDDTQGETPAGGAARAMKEMLPVLFPGVSNASLDARMLYSCPGQGSTPAIFLQRGNNPFFRLVDQIRAGVSQARIAGLTYRAPLMIRNQGEADMTLYNSAETFIDLVLKERRDIEREVLVASGVFMPIVCSQIQTNSFNLIEDGQQRQIAFAQAELARRHPFFLMAAPSYLSDYVTGVGSSGLHMDAAGQQLMGAYAKAAYLQSLFPDPSGRLAYEPARKFRGLRLVSAKAEGTHLINLTFDVPKPPLAIVTDWVTAIGNAGIQLARPGVGLQTLTLGGIHGGNQLTIRTTNPVRPYEDYVLIGVADTPDNGVAKAGRVFGPRTNLADSATHVFDPGPGLGRRNFRLRNYCQSAQMTVTR